MTERFRLRRATPDDSRATFDVFLASAVDLSERLNSPWHPDPEETRQRMGPLYERLGTHAAEWWLAEDGGSREVLGYARSVERGGLFELTEFFVHPGRQSNGVGAALLERAFPDGRGKVRVIIATADVRAQARYYRAGVAARFPIASLEAAPRAADVDPTVEVVPAGASDAGSLDEIESGVIEFGRGEEFGWLLETREGYLYRRDGRSIGFGFVGAAGSGPIAALDPADQPPILAHLETRAAELGRSSLAFEVPMVNDVAMRHLLGRGYRIDPFYTFLMSSRPFGRFDRFIGFSPPFTL